MTKSISGGYTFAGLVFRYEVELSNDLSDVIGVRVTCGGEDIEAREIWARTLNGMKPPMFETLEYHIILAAKEKAEDEWT